MAKPVTKKRLADGIYLLRFATQYELAATFMRFQEHYESVRFSGRIFTVEQIMDWYAAMYGDFTYFEDWAGFNVPSTALRAFYEGKFDPLLEKEKRLLRMFKGIKTPFYIIGIPPGASRSDYVHELTHALYFTDQDYRRAVRTAMRAYDTSAIERRLSEMGYARHVIPDEVHAYLIAPSDDVGRSKALAPLRRTLRASFRRHAKKHSIPLTHVTSGRRVH